MAFLRYLNSKSLLYIGIPEVKRLQSKKRIVSGLLEGKTFDVPTGQAVVFLQERINRKLDELRDKLVVSI